MKQVLIKKGVAVVERTPPPELLEGCALVETAYSFISAGTEMSVVASSGKPLYRRALDQPENVKKVMDLVRSHGAAKAVSVARGKLEGGTAVGYSCSGFVTAVGAGVTDLRPGDAVACAGAGKAVHAEFVAVPRNLIVRIPEGCGLKEASSVTLGAIAMQGARRAGVSLGDRVAVVGLGLLGNIAVQLLRAAGCRVLGVDVDPRRLDLARRAGARAAVDSSSESPVLAALNFSDQQGVDAVLVAAAGGDGVLQQATEMARKKGRIVVVGAVDLKLDRSPFYEKELDLLISCSYGPGRYDRLYEEEGRDYPFAYVRWTENRNMAEYLNMAAAGTIDCGLFIEKTFPVDDAGAAYESLKSSRDRPLGVALDYGKAAPSPAPPERSAGVSASAPPAVIWPRKKVRVALAGLGGFARAMHLPNLQRLKDRYEIAALQSRTGSNALNAAKQFSVPFHTSSYEELLSRPEVECVLIATPHDLHADMAVKALEAGKHVFLEKPLAIDRDGARKVKDACDRLRVNVLGGGPMFMVGFNRRFSPALTLLSKTLASRQGPVMMRYRVNAGRLPSNHWVYSRSGGGRAVGEACHMLDALQFLAGGKAVETLDVSAADAREGGLDPRENFSASLRFSDGSVGTLLYTSLGSGEFPKEHLEAFWDDKTAVVDDYKTLTGYGVKNLSWSSRTSEKGQYEELERFAEALLNRSAAPIPLEQMFAATELSFAVDRAILGGG